MQGELVLNATRTAQVIANVNASVPSRERRADDDELMLNVLRCHLTY